MARGRSLISLVLLVLIVFGTISTTGLVEVIFPFTRNTNSDGNEPWEAVTTTRGLPGEGAPRRLMVTREHGNQQVVTARAMTMSDARVTEGGTEYRDDKWGDKKDAMTMDLNSAGAPSGSGDFSGQIMANETLDLIKTEQLNTSNTYGDLARNDSFVIQQALEGYSNVSGIFDIENVTADIDHEIIEDNETNIQNEANATITKIATSFAVVHDKINITSIRIRLETVGTPSGKAYISGIGSNNQPNTTLIFGDQLALPSSASGWVILNYPSPVTLPKGSYFVVLEDNSSVRNCAENFNLDCYKWQYAPDEPGNENNSNMRKYNSLSGSWSNADEGDLFFAFSYYVVDPTDSSKLKTYTTPQEIDLKYNGTSLTSLTNNKLLLNGSVAFFTTNTSVTFDVRYRIHFASNLNPLTTTVTYRVTNGSTIVSWNVTISHGSVPTGAYQIQNRTLLFYNLPSDWNATRILYNETIFSNDPDGTSNNVTYTNGSATLLVNITSNTSAWDWRVEFVSPNYITALILTQNGTTQLTIPHEVNTTDLLQINASMRSGASGQNGTLLIHDFNGKLNHSETNVGVTAQGMLNFTEWNISATVNTNVNVNGTYRIEVQWIDSSGTKVGYFSVFVTVVVQTKLQSVTPLDLGEVVRGELVNITVKYASFHNDTNLKGATVTYSTSWGASGRLNQTTSHGNYATTPTLINTSIADLGPATITVTATLAGHVNRSLTFSLTIVANTTLDYVVNATTVQFHDVVEVHLMYKNESGHNLSSGVTIYRNLTSSNIIWQADNSSILTFNTSQLAPPTTTTAFTVNITVTKQYHLTQTLLLTFTLLPADASLTILEGHYANGTALSDVSNGSTIAVHYANDSSDQLTIKLLYNDTRHGKVITNAALSHNITSALATVNGTGVDQDLANGTWIITIDPHANGTFTARFEFTKDGFKPAVYVIHLDVKVTPTEVSIGGSLSWTFNGTVYEHATPIYYDEGSRDQFTILLTYNDTIYGTILENASFSYQLVDNVTNHVIIQEQLMNGSWQLTINPTGNDTFTLTVQFSQPGYQGQSLTFRIVVLATPTQALPTPSVSQVSVTFSEGHADNVNISLQFNDTAHNILIVNFTVDVTNGTNPYFTATPVPVDNVTWNVTINPLAAGTFVVQFRLSKSGYQTQLFNLTIIVARASFSSSMLLNRTLEIPFGTSNSTIVTITNAAHPTEVVENVTITITMNGTSTALLIVEELGNGQYNITYVGSLHFYHTSHEFVLTFSKENFNSTTVVWTFTVIPPDQPVATTLVLSQTSASAEWNDTITTVTATWQDEEHDIPLRGLIEQVNGTDVVLIYVESVNAYTYTLVIKPLTVGTWTIELKISNSTLSEYFANATAFMTVTGLPRSTGVVTLKGDSTVNDTVTVTYDRTSMFAIEWNDTELGTPIMNGMPQVTTSDSREWVAHVNGSNGLYYFEIRGLSMDGVLLNITLTSSLYQSQWILVTVIVLPLNTDAISATYTRGLLLENGTSKLGYTLGMALDWRVTDNNTVIHDPQFQVAINGTVITDLAARGITFSTDTDDVSALMRIPFLPKYGYQKGWYNITVWLGKYGLHNQSITVLVFVKGFDLSVSVKYDKQLVRGSSYVISVTVTYSNGTEVPSPLQLNDYFFLWSSSTGNLLTASMLLQQDDGTGVGIGSPASGIPVTFILEVILVNGMTTTLEGTVPTNSQGVASYTIDGSITSQLQAITSMTISVEGDAISDVFTKQIETSNEIRIIAGGPDIASIVIAAAATALVLGGFMFVGTKIRSRRAARKREKELQIKEMTERLQFIQNIDLILVTSQAGMPLYQLQHIRSAVPDEDFTTLLSGLISSIEVTLSSFQADILRQLRSQIEEVESEERPDAVTFKILDFMDSKLVMVASPKYRMFVLATDVPDFSKHMLKRIFSELEEKIQQLEIGLVQENSFKLPIEAILRKYLPIYLLRSFIVDLDVLDRLDAAAKQGEDIPISTRSLTVLKRLVCSFHPDGASIDEPDEQLKWYDEARQNGTLKESPKMDLATVLNILRQKMRLSIEETYEILWSVPTNPQLTSWSYQDLLIKWHPDELANQ